MHGGQIRNIVNFRSDRPLAQYVTINIIDSVPGIGNGKVFFDVLRAITIVLLFINTFALNSRKVSSVGKKVNYWIVAQIYS